MDGIISIPPVLVLCRRVFGDTQASNRSDVVLERRRESRIWVQARPFLDVGF
jgi:hypothetical protein